MKSFKLFPVLLFLTACGSGIPKYDATGTFEATEKSYKTNTRSLKRSIISLKSAMKC